MKRWIALCAMSACLLLAPSQSHAQVSAVLLKCTKSLSVAIACVIIEGGVAKVVDIGLDKLIEAAFGGDEKIDPEDTKPSTVKAADIEANGIEWSKLQEFLISIFKSETPADETQARSEIAASCAAKWDPICGYLGFAAPRETVDCSKITTQQDCTASFTCSWKDSSCAKHGGTKELFGP